ncbi:uncharacterized protein LOC131148081 [Malania oleifera]|uniref:uncharacterized protein LOC131148081 n=1 Tax=Malania oleifera TaxID=397392 RepID=UPI0025AE0235|nr:uncharacterized protein LOC131148081 [Malania oleifera]
MFVAPEKLQAMGKNRGSKLDDFYRRSKRSSRGCISHLLSGDSTVVRNNGRLSDSMMKSRDIIANVGGSSSEGAGHKAGSDSTSVLRDFAQQLMVEVVRTNRGQDCPMTDLSCSIEQFTRLKPSVFVGSVDPVRAKNWIQEIEKILDVLNYTEKQKVTFAKSWQGSLQDAKKVWKFHRGPRKEIYRQTAILQLQDFATLVNKATVAEECLLEDAEFQVPKKRPAPPSSSPGARQGDCMQCGRQGHRSRDCRVRGNSGTSQQPYKGNTQAQHGGQQRGTAQVRVYSLTPADVENACDVVTEVQLLNYELVVATPSGPVVECSYVVRNFLVEIHGRILQVDLVVYDMLGFDIIFGMDWLSSSYASINCHKREGYLEFLKDTPVEERDLEMIAVVCEFPDVFLEDLSRLPPDREVEFAIELAPGTAPILKAPYRMVPVELRELKE